MLIRIDDVSVNTDMDKLREMLRVIDHELFPANVMLAISPLVHRTSDERVFPLILNAHSDWREFYRVNRCELPSLQTLPRPSPVVFHASHGLIHVDHRLLSRATQEMSILVSCSLIEAKIFVPPFNKYNADTESICAEHGIELIKWEDNWQHLKYQPFDPSDQNGKWYFHTHDFTLEAFKRCLCPTMSSAS